MTTRDTAPFRKYPKPVTDFSVPSVNALRVFIADDHELLRLGRNRYLHPHPGWEICGSGKRCRCGLGKIREFKPDEAILDVSMPVLKRSFAVTNPD